MRPYVQLNTPGTIRYFVANLCAQPNKAAFIGSAFCRGHEPLAFVWESAGLRCPTITTVVSSRLLVQFIWELESPVTTSPNGRSRREPIRFLHNTLGTLAHESGGKFVSSRPPALALNPLHSDFQTIWRQCRYSLEELASCVSTYAPPMSRRTQRRLSRTSNRKRRQTFFDELKKLRLQARQALRQRGRTQDRRRPTRWRRKSCSSSAPRGSGDRENSRQNLKVDLAQPSSTRRILGSQW